MDCSRVNTCDLTEDRLDANYYGTDFLANARLLATCGLPQKAIGSISERCNCGATPKLVQYNHNGTGLIRTADVRPNLFKADGVLRTRDLRVAAESATAAVAGDMLYTMSGTVGYAAVIPPTDEIFSFSNTIARARFSNTSENDIHFVSTFFNSTFGYKQSLRLVSGGIQGHVMPNPFKRLPVPLPQRDAQRYIGKKVRLSETLRSMANATGAHLRRMTRLCQLDTALRHPERKTCRAAAADLETRIDPKFYEGRALATLKACQGISDSNIDSLHPRVSNGFEYREFVTSGLPYITVSEVSAGRLNVENAPCIPSDTKVPNKALINSRCVLVVRTGSIGIAVKVHEEDTGCSISSHLIRLEFDDEQTAAAVATFLMAPAGEILLHKISYGAVQPQLGQEELLSLPVPREFLCNSAHLLDLLNDSEIRLRSAARLTSAAKHLVEALIEGRVTEAELAAAQHALDAGDPAPDRALLSRLSRSGFDLPGEPLFPDLEALEAALRDGESAMEVPA